MRITLTVSYDGTAYCGWQIQPNGVTVQEVLQNAIFSLTGERVSVTGSGRTDAGVHAKGQVAHFDTESSIPPERFYLALNPLLPKDIKVIKSAIAPGGFDARKSAKRKTYCYTLYKSDVELPLIDGYAMRIDNGVNLDKMKEVAKLIEGEHDFKAFSRAGGSAKTTVRTVYKIDIADDGEKINIFVCGNGFLYNMVRIIAGTLLVAGEGKLDGNSVKAMLETGRRVEGVKTCPAKGLCLVSVEY